MVKTNKHINQFYPRLHWYKAFILCGIILSTILVGCRLNNGADDAETVDFNADPLPPYIRLLWPQPGSSIALDQYETSLMYDQSEPGVCVEFTVQAFLEEGDFLSAEEWAARFNMNIDDQQHEVPDYVFLRDSAGLEVTDPETGNRLYYIPPGDPFLLCFYSNLGIGTHTVTFTGRKTSSEDLSYSWSFRITDN